MDEFPHWRQSRTSRTWGPTLRVLAFEHPRRRAPIGRRRAHHARHVPRLALRTRTLDLVGEPSSRPSQPQTVERLTPTARAAAPTWAPARRRSSSRARVWSVSFVGRIGQRGSWTRSPARATPFPARHLARPTLVIAETLLAPGQRWSPAMSEGSCWVRLSARAPSRTRCSRRVFSSAPRSVVELTVAGR